MKVLEVDYRRGIIEVLLEVPEDIYYLALLIDRGDTVYSWTYRQLKIEREGGVERGERIKVYLGLLVEKVSYYKFSKKIRITGKVVEAPEKLHVKGSYHTITVGVGDAIKVLKHQGKVTSFVRQILERAQSQSKRFLIISIGDEEIAVGTLSPIGISVDSVAGFSPSKSFQSKSIMEMYGPAIEKILKRILFSEARKNSYDKVIVATTEKLAPVVRKIMERLSSSYVLVKVSEGGLSGIYEIARRDDLKKFFKEVRGLWEKEEVDELVTRLYRGDNRVLLGIDDIERASEWGVIKKVIVLEDLLFSEKFREKVLKILNLVYEKSGKIVIISSESEAGETLKHLGGIAAILYYPFTPS